MGTPRTIRVFLVADKSANRRRWTKWIEPLSDMVLIDVEADAPGDMDIVVTDRLPIADRLPGAQQRLAGGEIGVIAIGRSGPADVSLPSNVTRRELELACRLLSQIVRLRRRQRVGDRKQDELRQLVNTDPLTELPNLRGWQTQLSSRLIDRSRRNVPLCLAILDLDCFKTINDQHGHACGDAVLKNTARALGTGIRDGDLVARLGGDEFGVAVWVPDIATAQQVVERVRQCIQAHLSGSDLPTVTASAGFSLATPNALDTPKTLFEAADTALRQAKKDGRDRTAFQPAV